ncbi:Nitrogen permease regulator 2 [Hypoxylon texense]
MLPITPFSSAPRTPLTLCQRCLLRSIAARRQQARNISTSFLKKQEEAKEKWEERAKLIEEGKIPHLWDTLKERGYVKDLAGTEDQIRELMLRKRIGAYVGIDPTAPSLHVGHLLPLMPLFWMYIHGYRTISLIGGATAKIGDPTDRLQSRDPMTKSDMTMNITKMHYQLKRIWLNVEEQAKRYGYEKENRIWSRALYNNSQWYSSLSFIEVVSRLFKGIRLGPMLSRETVKRKMEKGDGMSLDEFVYPLMQAWDWWHMFRKMGVRMQIGGSDQYGNIISGVESIKYLRDSEPDPSEKFPDDLVNTPVGFTVPLLTDSSGAKFGKSSGNAVWLDQFLTSTFSLYGYFMRRPDADVENLLKLFTFIPLEDISKIMEQHNQDPPSRVAQHTLAYEVVALIHGQDTAKEIQAQHKGFFSKQGSDPVPFFPADEPSTANLASAFRVDIQLPESLILGKSISRILYAAGLADSVSDGNRLTKHQGAYIGGAPGQPSATNRGMSFGDLTYTPIKNWFPQDTRNFLIDGKILILRRGKHFVRVVEMVSDAAWEASGMMYFGEPGTGRVRLLREALQSAASASGGKDLAALDGPEAREAFLDRAEAMYADEGGRLRGLPSEAPLVNKTRARQILDQSFRSFAFVGESGARATKVKTAEIDSILERTRTHLDDHVARHLAKEEQLRHKRHRREKAGHEALGFTKVTVG